MIIVLGFVQQGRVFFFFFLGGAQKMCADAHHEREANSPLYGRGQGAFSGP